MRDLGHNLTCTGFGRQESGITNGRTFIIPSEDLREESEQRTVLIELSGQASQYDLEGVFIACNYHFLTESNRDQPQYASKQDLEVWFPVVP